MESFRKDALLGKELKYLEEQRIIDSARIRNLRSPKIKGRIESVKESTANLSKEIDDYAEEMNDDEYREYRKSAINSKKEIKEPIEFSLLRQSIAAALSSASDDYDEVAFEEEEEASFTEASEVSINMDGEKDNQKIHSPISKSTRSPNYKTFSMTNFYQTSNSRIKQDSNSRTMKYEDLMTSVESPINPPETNRAIEIADKVRVKLYSPYMTKRSLEPTLPQNLSMASIYRTPQNSRNFKNTNFNGSRSIKTNNYSKYLNQIFSSSTPHKTVEDINGVTEHVQRLRRAKQVTPTKKNTDDFDEYREVIVPDIPIITPNRTKLEHLFSKEIDKILEETEHKIIMEQNLS